MEKIVEHKLLGEITLRKRRGLKRITIRVDRSARVILSMPYSISTNDGLAFVASKIDWIQKSLTTIRARHSEHQLIPIGNRRSTRSHVLDMIPEPRKSFRTTITSDRIIVRYPMNLQIESAALQQHLKLALIKTLMLEAKELIPRMVAKEAMLVGFRYNQVSVKNIHSRWGSCSSRNNLNFSIYLVLLPDHLIRYVILHELCHTIEKNHGAAFWELLDKHCKGNAKQLALEMKNYTTHIF